MSVPVIVSVTRDSGMYSDCVKDNPFCSGCRLVAYDNLTDNVPIPVRYNSFIDTLAPGDDFWIVFCHEDWKAGESVMGFTASLNPLRIYGPVGAYVRPGRKSDRILYRGAVTQCHKDGSKPITIFFNSRSGIVDTLDCQCIIVHSSLFLKYGLRFDEKLCFDLYGEDFSASALRNFGILTEVIPIQCTHYSYGDTRERFFQSLEYLRGKYAGCPKRFGTIVGYKITFGGNQRRPIHRADAGRDNPPMRVLVVFHIYYSNLADYYLKKLSNIHSCSWDLIVTGPGLSQEIRDNVRTVKPDAVFLQTENVGYDIWPFIAAIRSVNPADYDFVIKLHTKNEDGFTNFLNARRMDGTRWKEYLVNPLLGDGKSFDDLMKLFSRHPDVGLAYSRQLDFVSKDAKPEDGEMLDSELSRLGITRSESHFCAGTMMAIRADALKFLQEGDISAATFSPSGNSHGTATMAHVYERLIPIGVQSQGLRYKPLFDNLLQKIRFRIKDFMKPVGEWVFYINHYKGYDSHIVIIFGHRFIIPVNRRKGC